MLQFVWIGCFSEVVYGGETVSFSWAFFMKQEGGQVRSLAFETPEAVASGELFRIYLELHNGSFLYLFLFDSREDLYLVFPPSGSFYNGDFAAGYKSYIPSGREWFSLDDLKGTERFYLLASSKRLFELEKLTDRFLATGDQLLKQQLLEKIEGVAEKFAAAPQLKTDQISVHHGEWLGNSNLPPLVGARKISASGDFSKILDMVSK